MEDKAKMKKEILKTRGKLFSVEFIKKDGSNRKMICMLGVKKHLKGGISKNTNTDHVIVYDMESKGYRTINTNTVHTLNCGGYTYEVTK